MEELGEVKQRNRAVWAAGDFDQVAGFIWDVGERLVNAVGVDAGERVLDIGAGTGNAAIRAAERGADVIASDLTPELFDAGRERARSAEVEFDWVEADAEDLPFEDGSFDVVLSVFGHMFAPRHAVAAAELTRVLAADGRIGLCCWTPDGNVGDFFATVSKHMPPPPSIVEPPPLWGNREHAAEMLAGGGLELEFEEQVTGIILPDAEAGVDHYATYFGPVVMARAALEPEGKWDALRDDLIGLFEEQSVPVDEGIRLDSQYLLITGKRSG